MMEITADTVEKAVCQFYQSQSNIHAQVHEWLEKAKHSPQAWVFVWDLLLPQKTPEVQFFAATTLHNKIKKSLNELAQENVSALREKLITTLAVYSNTGPRIIINRLCLSISAYFLQTCPEKWSDALPALLILFAPENLPHVPAERILWVLFEILSVLPEELSSANLDQHHKGLICHHLIEHTPLIMELLEKTLQTYNYEEVILQALKCATSWITIGVPFTEYQNLNSIILNLIFSMHKEHSLILEKSLEFLKVIVDLPENHKYPNHLLEFLKRILPLGDIVSREITLEKAANQELIRNIYHLFVTFGGTHAKLCLNWIKQGDDIRQNVMLLVSHILQCTGAKGYYPRDETYSRLTFGFWYSLQDEITFSPPKDIDFYMKYLGPVYKELVNVLISKAQIPGPEQNFTKQDLESFRCYRQDISDTLMYCHSILHESTICIIQSKLNKVNINESKWQELEACLFGLCSVSENVEVGESNLLPSLFQFIRDLPFQKLDPKVLSTALDTIGAYANWLSAHSLCLEHVLPVIILGLNFPETTSNATMALKDVARDCQYDIKPYSSLLLNASQSALHGGKLKVNDSQRLMCTVGLLLSALPMDTIMHYLNLILTPYMDQLNSLAIQEPSPSVKNDILLCLKMISVLSAHLNTKLDSSADAPNMNTKILINEPQPVLLILQKLFPVIKSIADSWSIDEHVMQALFVLLKHSITTLLEDAQPVVTDVLNFIVSTYRLRPQPAALDLSKTICTLFGKDEKYQSMIQTLTNELCSVAMTNLATASTLSDHTDLLEALFTYLTQVLRKIPKLMLNTDAVTLFQCGIVSLALPESSTVKSAAAFLVNFINQSAEWESLKSVVNACGERLVHQMVSCIAGEATRSNIEPLAGILLALNKHYCENHSHWLRGAVTKNVCPRSTPQQRDNFVRTVLQCQRNKEQLQENVKKFSLICRGIIGTEYAQSGTPYF